MSHRHRLLLTCLALAGITGCPISQPIIITFPADAAWTFQYRDALGEELGGGKASVSLTDDGSRLTAQFTEAAFGDRARLQAEVLTAWTQANPWVPFRGSGTWFTGEAFTFSGCIDPRAGVVAPGAVAYLTTEFPRLSVHPLVKEPCKRTDKVKSFEDSDVDKIFTWSARLK